jgi:hypothetical protein
MKTIVENIVIYLAMVFNPKLLVGFVRKQLDFPMPAMSAEEIEAIKNQPMFNSAANR